MRRQINSVGISCSNSCNEWYARDSFMPIRIYLIYQLVSNALEGKWK
jgi:hypothetical protein